MMINNSPGSTCAPEQFQVFKITLSIANMTFLGTQTLVERPDIAGSAGNLKPGAVVRKVSNPRPANLLDFPPVSNSIESARSKKRAVAGPSSVFPNDRSTWIKRLHDLHRRTSEAEIELREGKAAILGIPSFLLDSLFKNGYDPKDMAAAEAIRDRLMDVGLAYIREGGLWDSVQRWPYILAAGETGLRKKILSCAFEDADWVLQNCISENRPHGQDRMRLKAVRSMLAAQESNPGKSRMALAVNIVREEYKTEAKVDKNTLEELAYRLLQDEVAWVKSRKVPHGDYVRIAKKKKVNPWKFE
ncbi:hypothetical protein BZA77DRAFT_295233 [Pyronema omphalodes]|nr:hypothetical protein BZA77DRAFT_295233 [Pyronema omphalodes]